MASSKATPYVTIAGHKMRRVLFDAITEGATNKGTYLVGSYALLETDMTATSYTTVSYHGRHGYKLYTWERITDKVLYIETFPTVEQTVTRMAQLAGLHLWKARTP